MALSPDIMKTYGRIDIAFTHGKGSFYFLRMEVNI